MKRQRWLGVVCVVAIAACSDAPSVVSTRSVALPAPFDRATPLAEVAALPDIDLVDWGECESQVAPWECGTIDVPLDYRRAADVRTVTISVTRLPATDDDARIGSLVLNPGGPGGSGVDLAWGYASLFPSELLARFDLIGFDPRGVSRSTPVDCGDLNRSFRVVERDCVARSGDLLPFVGTQNAARDMEQLRKSLGDEQLTYLGFSYGTALGAVYANLFPESVRALVLDGSVDPAAGEYNIDGTVVGSYGSPFYGVQDFGGTIAVFLELCDATRTCAAGPRSSALVDDLSFSVDDAATDYFAEWDDTVTAGQVDGIITSAMYNTDLWAPLAVGLADAAEGDASTLAALGSYLEAGYPREEVVTDNLSEANLAIYCADFAGRRGRFAVEWCSGWPETAEPIPPIAAVDVANPIVVIGTDGDPATPGFLAPQMANALGDAVSVRWQGAGHTAFLQSECIDQIVVSYLIDLVVPKDRTRCGFTDDINTTVARAERVFEVNRQRFEMRLTDVFVAEGSSTQVAGCLAIALVAEATDSQLVYARLGVQQPEYVRLRNRLEKACD